MSKIGKKIIQVPAGVDVKIDGNLLTVKGPKGELVRTFPEGTKFKFENNELVVEKMDSALWGLSRALASNMIQGVSVGFQKILDFTGVGYKAAVKGDAIELNLGFTNPITVPAPKAVTFKVEKNSIIIEGPDNESIGQVAALIRKLRPPEPYKGSGIKYRGEVIKRKAGKKAAGTTA